MDPRQMERGRRRRRPSPPRSKVGATQHTRARAFSLFSRTHHPCLSGRHGFHGASYWCRRTWTTTPFLSLLADRVQCNVARPLVKVWLHACTTGPASVLSFRRGKRRHAPGSCNFLKRSIFWTFRIYKAANRSRRPVSSSSCWPAGRPAGWLVVLQHESTQIDGVYAAASNKTFGRVRRRHGCARRDGAAAALAAGHHYGVHWKLLQIILNKQLDKIIAYCTIHAVVDV